MRRSVTSNGCCLDVRKIQEASARVAAFVRWENREDAMQEAALCMIEAGSIGLGVRIAKRRAIDRLRADVSRRPRSLNGSLAFQGCHFDPLIPHR